MNDEVREKRWKCGAHARDAENRTSSRVPNLEPCRPEAGVKTERNLEMNNGKGSGRSGRTWDAWPRADENGERLCLCLTGSCEPGDH